MLSVLFLEHNSIVSVYLSLELTVQKSFQDLRSSFAVLKVRDLPLDASRPIPLQIQVMSLLVDVGTEDNNEESRRAIYLQNMHQITRHLLAPLAISIRAAAQQVSFPFLNRF